MKEKKLYNLVKSKRIILFGAKKNGMIFNDRMDHKKTHHELIKTVRMRVSRL